MNRKKKEILVKAATFLKSHEDYKIFHKFVDLIGIENILFVGVVGSFAHGTATEKSDFDFKVIYKLSNRRFLGLTDEHDSLYVLRSEEDRDALKKQINKKNDGIIFQIDNSELKGILKSDLYHTLHYERNNSTEGLLLDINGMELGHFAKQLRKSNPNMLELLYLPKDCIIYIDKSFRRFINNRDKFLTKESKNLFVNYAKEQFNKMKGDKKKFRLSKEDMRIRKSPLHFIKVLQGNKEVKLIDWLKENEYDQRFCGVVPIPHSHKKLVNFIQYHSEEKDVWNSLSLHLSNQLQLLASTGHNKNPDKAGANSYRYRHAFALFYDKGSELCFSEKYSNEERVENKKVYKGQFKKFRGIVKEDDDGKLLSNELRLSSIPKNDKLICVMVYDQNGFSEYCKLYKEYWKWDKDKNEVRYQMNLEHGEGYDSKNAYHMIRILESYKELLETGELRVRRKECRDYYMKIKKGDFKYEEIVDYANELTIDINTLYEETNIPDTINLDILNELIFKTRRGRFSLKNLIT